MPQGKHTYIQKASKEYNYKSYIDQNGGQQQLP